MLNIVRHHLKQYHIRSQTISGEIKISDRQLIVEAFNSDENRFMVKIKESIFKKFTYFFILGSSFIIKSRW
jgi:hypothetical protein